MTRREWVAAVAGWVVSAARRDEWVSLFDSVSLGQWEQTSFGGEGPVRVTDGVIVLEMGDPLTGVTWRGDALPAAYELELDAARWAGNDFFCGLTFPVGQSSCSLILGGWGGTTVGLSNIDGRDASENETTREIRFEDRRWYRVKVSVTASHIRAWLDETPIVEVALAGCGLVPDARRPQAPALPAIVKRGQPQ
jgi:hypothetical protein